MPINSTGEAADENDLAGLATSSRIKAARPAAQVVVACKLNSKQLKAATRRQPYTFWLH